MRNRVDPRYWGVVAILALSLFNNAKAIDFINETKNATISLPDKSHPPMQMQKWVSENFANGDQADWIQNNCAEGIRVIDPRSPNCVESIVMIGEGKSLHISFLVGVKDGKFAGPHLFQMYTITSASTGTSLIGRIETLQEVLALYGN